MCKKTLVEIFVLLFVVQSLGQNMCLKEDNRLDLNEESQTCTESKFENISPCPENFEKFSNVSERIYCILFIKNVTFPPPCPYPHEPPAPFDVTISYLKNNSKFLSVWMPAQRVYRESNLDLIYWISPTENYLTPVLVNDTDPYKYKGSLHGKDCLIYILGEEEEYFEAVGCNETHDALCIFESLKTREYSLCSQHCGNHCRQATYDSPMQCFCKQNQTNVLADFKEPYQNTLVDKILNDSDECYFGLKRDGQSLKWVTSGLSVNYSYFCSSEWCKNPGAVYGAVTTKGWVLKSEPPYNRTVNCSINQFTIIESDVLQPPPSITLTYEDHLLKATVTNHIIFHRFGSLKDKQKNDIIFCYTDARKYKLIAQIFIFKNNSTCDESKTCKANIGFDNPSGNFWCEGFVYPNLTLIKSNKILVRQQNIFSEEYAVKISQSYTGVENPLTYHYVVFLHNQAKNWLQERSYLDTNILSLDDLDERDKKITYTFHITSNSPNSSNYDYLLEVIGNKTQENITIINFSVVDYCMGEQSKVNNMTWPKTVNGSIANRTMEGYCLYDNGEWASRHCIGNFINGAQWQQELNVTCTIFGYSNITDRLFELLITDVKKEVVKLENVTTLLKSINTSLEYIDLYFIYKILIKSESSCLSTDLNAMLFILNSIIDKFPTNEDPLPSLSSIERILSHYQNRILNCLNKINESSLKDTFPWLKLKLYSHKANEVLYGLILQNDKIKEVKEPISIEYLENEENVDSAIIFSKELISQLNNSTFNLALTVFLKTLKIDGLRSDLNMKIYSFILDKDNVVTSPITIYLNCSHYSNNRENKCAFRHSERKWILSEPNMESKNLCSKFMTCTFPSISSYFTVSSNKFNVTSDLMYLKNISNENVLNNLKTIFVLVSHVAKLEKRGIEIVTEILEDADRSVSENTSLQNDISLSIFSDIISNLMKTRKEVMKEAKLSSNVPDRLLGVSKSISKQLKHSDNDNENFNIIVSDDKKPKLLGFMYKKDCSPNCGLKEINESMTLEDLHNVEAAVFFDKKLLNQNFILTAYSNDALFSETYENPRNVSKIFGLDLRNGENIQGNISILYNVSAKGHYSDNCVYWDAKSKRWIDEYLYTSDNVGNMRKCDFNLKSYFTLEYLHEETENVTRDIEDILNSTLSPPEKIEKLVSVSNRHKYFIPIDVHLVCQIFYESASSSMAHNILSVSQIVDNLMKVSRNTLVQSESEYQATDGILNCLDNIISSKNTTEQYLLEQEEKEEVGKHFIGENLNTIIVDLNDNNTVGLSISNCAKKCQVDLFQRYKTLEELEKINEFEAAVFLSRELLEQVKTASVVSKLVVTTFLKDSLFNEVKSLPKHNTSTIFGVLLPDFKEKFKGPVNIYYNRKEHVPKSCAFWNFSVSDSKNFNGFWQNDSQEFKEKNSKIVGCQFYHLTHFALLLAGVEINDKYHLLDIVTLVNCSLSLFGVMGILMTAILFEKWRRNTGNKILLNFSLSLTIKIVMLYVSGAVFDTNNMDRFICTLCGAILHYALLSEFCWMLVIAILQFKRFVEVLGGPPKYVLLKACICGWIFPIFPILILLILDPGNYAQGNTALCYPSDLGLYLGVWLPIIIIVGINFVIFLYIIINVFVSQNSKNKETINNEMMFQWRLALLLFFMLGMTWIFGFLGLIQNMYAFLYLFCFTATLQGFIMFLFFILFNQSTRMLYWHSFKLWLYSKNLIKL